jgi:hypothetical protein
MYNNEASLPHMSCRQPWSLILAPNQLRNTATVDENKKLPLLPILYSHANTVIANLLNKLIFKTV